MTTSSTSLLGLALPVTGELNGTWGDVVNNSLTSLLDTAIAGTTVLSTDADVTLTTTALAANQARQAVLLCSGARTALRTITAPAQSKIYVVINNTSGGYGVKVVGVGPTTGVTIPAGKVYMLVWNGSDFVTTGVTTVDLATDVTGILPTANGGTGLGGATPFTANGVVYASSASALTTGSTLVFIGDQLFVNSVKVSRGGGSISTNTAIGASALFSNSTGSSNTALGQFALYYNSTGSFNTAVGNQAAYGNNTGSNNTVVGYQAGYSNSTGNITAFGTLAGFSNTTGASNTALGYNALNNNTTASNQTAVGDQAMYYMRGGSNTAMGTQALRGSTTPANNTGAENVAIGFQALYSTTSSSNNVAIGSTALFSTTTGGANTAVGDRALVFNTGGAANTAVGNYALYNSTASNNVAVGAQASYLNSTGTLNTALGTTALLTNSTGSSNTAIGRNALYAATGSFNTALGEGSGSAVTTGAKNTIVGRYSGNQGGLDIRTASNYIVLSDGDGNPRASWNGPDATFRGALTVYDALRTGTAGFSGFGAVTPPSDGCNQINVYISGGDISFAAPSGTPESGQKLIIRILGDTVSRNITSWNASYRAIGTTLPTTIAASKTTYVGCIYNDNASKWDVVAVSTEV